jgi:hypothetical protein
MTRFSRFAPLALIALGVLLSTSGCKSNPAQNADNAAAPQDSSADPASANLAPVSTDSGTQAATSSAPAAQPSAAPAEAPSAPQSAPAPDYGASSGSYDQASGGEVDDASYGEQPAYTAPQPPPALPEYQQPPAPGDGYAWTPGYWSYSPAGYYWVPGVWVQTPYVGALWTPGYWGWTGGHYGFFRGYWGRHIGFYGGVNYGYGYGGVGYQGGYWNGDHFFYNRAVNNINITVIHNVYDYRVVTNNTVRVSFNGGPGGVRIRPRPAEIVALREPHAPPMHAQLENEHAASVNRANFVSQNHGRPAAAVIERPLAADRDVRPVAAPVRVETPRPEARPAPAPVRAVEPARNEAGPPARTQPATHMEQRTAPRPEAARPRTEEHAAPHAAPRPEERPAPHAAAAKPAAHPESKPAPHPQAKPEQPKHEEEHPR